MATFTAITNIIHNTFTRFYPGYIEDEKRLSMSLVALSEFRKRCRTSPN